MVCTIHDICFEHYRNIFTKTEYLRQKLLIPYSARKSDYIITVSEFSKKDIIEHYGVDSERIVVAHNATNDKFRILDVNELQEGELRKRYGIGECPYLLTVGNLQPRKNLPRLIDAFHAWKNKRSSNSKLVIVGKKAWMYTETLKAADSSDVILTDYVPDEDLVRLYNAATAFIYPSLFEGFGIPPLEAMACGTAVAVSNSSSIPEVVGDAGLYFNPYSRDEICDAIDSLMNNALSQGLVKEGLKQVNRFSWGRSAEVIYKTYHKCKAE